MQLSYWEKKTWFENIDHCIIGSGIVGLNCALALRKQFPEAKILVLEKGMLPQGASTKNAGFACFGSISELLSDLKNHSADEVKELVEQRNQGLQLMRQNLGDQAIRLQKNGGYELFLSQDQELFEDCKSHLSEINEWLYPIFDADVFHIRKQEFGFKNCLPEMILNPFEGQIDTGKMMQNLLKKVQAEGVLILNATDVISFSADQSNVKIKLKDFEFTASQLFIATNAFAQQLLDVQLTPARNQVIITEPIHNLSIKGSFHLDRGYYYFRNIDDRILLGGGRHLDEERETTTELGLTNTIQHQLDKLLDEVILPDQHVEIDQRWSGILATGSQKRPIIKSIDKNVYCAVRLGGMGVAIGSEVGRKLASLSHT